MRACPSFVDTPVLARPSLIFLLLLPAAGHLGMQHWHHAGVSEVHEGMIPQKQKIFYFFLDFCLISAVRPSCGTQDDVSENDDRAHAGSEAVFSLLSVGFIGAPSLALAPAIQLWLGLLAAPCSNRGSSISSMFWQLIALPILFVAAMCGNGDDECHFDWG